MKIYVVTMYRYGDRESHSYVLGVFSEKNIAIHTGLFEEAWRGTKYTCEVLEFVLDSPEKYSDTILRLERHNPLDLTE